MSHAVSTQSAADPLDYFKSLFRKTSHLDAAVKELEEAKLAQLEAETARDYASAIVDYNKCRVARLQEYLKGKYPIKSL